MHIVVTGASGNVGTALLGALRARHPEWTVTGVCRRPPETGAAPYDAARWVAADLTAPTATETLTTVMQGAAAVVHLAWAIQPSHDVDFMTRVNLDGSRRVLEAVRAAGVTHLAYASSVGAYRSAGDKRYVTEDWPADGIPTSLYSRHKAAVEAMLDGIAPEGSEPGAGLVVTRVRPGLVLHEDAGSEIARYFLGSALPTPLLGRIPVVPLPPGLVAAAVHADDLADAFVRVLERRPAGAVNVAADDLITPTALAAALGGRPVPVPAAALRALVEASWRARLQPTDAGWLDLALQTPLMDTGRAKRELGWTPTRRVDDALRGLIKGMAQGRGTASPALAPRSLVRDLLPNRVRMRA